MGSFVVTEARLTRAPAIDQAQGLIGYLKVVLSGGLALDGLTLRRTRDGRLTVSFPSRRDAAGRERFFIRPITNQAQLDVEAQILVLLDIEKGAPSATS